MRLIVLALFTVLFSGFTAQQDTTTPKPSTYAGLLSDSLTVVKPHPDTLSAFIAMPDSTRRDQFVDTLLKQNAFNPFLFSSHTLKQIQLRMGKERPQRDTWVVVVILFLLIYLGLLNRIMGKDILNVIQAFYTKASFVKLSREDNLLTSWAFIFLFLLFGLTIGLFIYQVTQHYGAAFSISGFQLFIACAIIVIVVFIVKILVLRVLGFIFDIPKMVNEYISVLYLSYFNLTFIFLPLVICFCLFPAPFIPALLGISAAIVVTVVLIQSVRSILNIISNFTFPKIYLFIYLCALEICPVLILIKALDL